MLRYLQVASKSRTQFIDITASICDLLNSAGVRNGVCHLFVLHTTAGITVNEGADPAVQRDMNSYLSKLVPNDPEFTHAEGNSAAHIKTTLVGTAQTLLIENCRPILGTWQSVYLCEFDGPRQRKIAVKILAFD